MEKALYPNGTVNGSVRLLLRLEGLAVLAAATLLYAHMQFSWVYFALLFLTPDVFMIGYTLNKHAGAHLYNFGHSYTTALLLAGIGFTLQHDAIVAASIIWVAHIGFDRCVGYDLKYTDSFKHTHLSAPLQQAENS